MEDHFSSSHDGSVWFQESETGGFGYVSTKLYDKRETHLINSFRNNKSGNITNLKTNSVVRDDSLYIVPTMASHVIGQHAVFDGYMYNAIRCTNADLTSCEGISNSITMIVFNAQSGHRTTKYNHSNYTDTLKYEYASTPPSG